MWQEIKDLTVGEARARLAEEDELRKVLLRLPSRRIMNPKELTAAQKKALSSLYNKEFMAAYKTEIVRVAKRDAAKAARAFSKHPSRQKEIKRLTEAFLKKELPAIVKKMVKDAEILM